MSFINCLQTAETDGLITSARSRAGQKAYQDQYDAAKALGVDDARAATGAQDAAIKATTDALAQKRWEKINQLKAAHDIHNKVNATTNMAELENYLIRKGDALENSYNRILGQALSLFGQNLETYRPKVIGLYNSNRYMDEIVDVAYGGKGGPEAKQLVKEIEDVGAFMRNLANSKGASIPENKNYFLPQMHDAMTMRRIDPTSEANSMKLWVEDHLDALDWNVMRYDGKPILPQNRRETLEKVWRAIVTDGYNKIVPGQTATEHLASRMNQQRFLYYKDADSWKRMNKKYSDSNVFQQMITTLDSMARDISILETMGPNPPAMQRYQQALMQKRAADLAETQQTPKEKRFVRRADEALKLFDRRYTVQSRSFLSGSENGVAQVVGTVRTVAITSLLQAAYIANLGDLGFLKMAARHNGLPASGLVRGYAKNFVPNEENRQWAIQSALAYESGISQVLANNRFFGPMGGAAIARRFSDTVFRGSLLTQHNQTARWVWGMQVMGGFAVYRKQSWSNLPLNFRDSLVRNNITEADWDIFRQTAPNRHQGAEFLRPTDLWNKQGATAKDRAIADKFLSYIYDTGKMAVPEQTSRTQQALGGHLDRPGFLGQSAQVLNVVKGFPLVMHFIHMRDIAQMQTRGQRMQSLASFFAYMTVAGAFITQARELANGRNPRDMTDPYFWLTAMVNGGSLGLLGDVAAGLAGRPGGFESAIVSPLVDFTGDTLGLTAGNAFKVSRNLLAVARGRPEDAEDVNLATESIQYLSRYGITGWQLRLLFRRTLEHEVLKNSDPQAYRRLLQRERRREQETGQGSWWAPGEAQPRGAPDFRGVLGD